MVSLPLDVHEVLEEEYAAQHEEAGPAPGAEYKAEDLVDIEWAQTIAKACGLEGATLAALNALVTTGSAETPARLGMKALKKSPALTDDGRRLLTMYLKGQTAQTAEVRRPIVDDAFCGAVRSWRDVRLSALYAKLHAEDDGKARAALCISGGGIRSATFALGVIQGLAGAGILDKFHYLSTVSGGGYIGGWLSSWARRHPAGMSGVQEELKNAGTSKVDPEPAPLQHLREYSNFLSPKLGAVAADTWTIAALHVRNLLLNLLVLVPVLAALLAMPRLYENLLQGNRGINMQFVGAVTLLGLFAGFGYIGLARPVRHGRESFTSPINTNGWFTFLCILPLTVAGFGMSLFWARLSMPNTNITLAQAWPWIFAAAALMTLWPCAIYYARYSQASFAERRQSAARSGKWHFAKKLGLEALAAIVALVTAAALLALLATKAFPDPLRAPADANRFAVAVRHLVPLPMAEIYVCFAVPLVLLVFYLQASIFVGISSLVNEDADREWWGRAGAMLLMVAILGGGASFIAVFGPVLLYRAPAILGTLGGVSGIAAALLSYSAKSSADNEKGSSALTNAALALAAPLFALFLLASISLGTTELLRLIDFQHQKSKASAAVERRVTIDAQFTASITRKLGRGNIEQKDELTGVPLASVETLRAVNHLREVQGTDWTELVFIGALAFGAWLLSLTIGVNRFSMHAFYRNRLIRAYLGASRYNRDPDRFTGFDENDNMQMYEMRRELLWPNAVGNPRAFVDAIAAHASPVTKRIWDSLGAKVQRKVNDAMKSGVVPGTLVAAIAQSINALMQSADLVTGAPDANIVSLLQRNRKTIESALPSIAPLPPRGPMHVVNTTLNLVAGDNLAWQQRKAESFTISPLHCGSPRRGYRDAREYGGDDGISLGTAVALSGAAASPNMGHYSSAPLAFIMTLLNVRLGAWLGNPGLAGKGTFNEASPKGNLRTLFYELTGNTNDHCPWVYLSDGGHFENLALFEMVLRRCRFIVCTDAAGDPDMAFGDLGNAIRKIRIDLGVPIDLDGQQMSPRPAPGQPLRAGSYMATATIRYSAIDGPGAKDGLLIYVKPSVYNEPTLPRDVFNYAQESPTFPHETTADQFFSESQFESYRALGKHVFEVIHGNPKPPYANVPAFANAMRPPQPATVGFAQGTPMLLPTATPPPPAP